MEELIEQAKAGDERALLELFQSHRDRLARMINLRMDRRIQARVSESDVLQEAYLILAQQLPNYSKKPDLPFFLWLRRIAGQCLAKIHRRHLGQEMRSVNREVRYANQVAPDASSVYMAAELIDQLSSPSVKAVRNEMLEQVKSAIDSLSEGDREIIALRHGELLSNEEIAILMEISNKAASMRYTRAILKLKDLLDNITGILD